jgi:radical SAM/Cys-rich protein
VTVLDGPKATSSLAARGSPLASTKKQLELLASLPASAGDFSKSAGELRPAPLEIFQINVGRLCNMTCLHCHVDAGPDRVRENMDRATLEACLRLLDRTTAHSVDITGGAPELHPDFRWLVDQCVSRGKKVMDRCNLTVLLLPRNEGLVEYMAERGVEVVGSLPHSRKRNTDLQRGDGTFDKSIEALKRLNAAGYGKGDPKRRLTLVSNPVGAFLAGNQAELEREWKQSLLESHGVTFDRLLVLNNMPISRFLEWLERSGNLQAYMETLVNAFNPATISGLMCRNTLSISWDGKLYDCDFNQMLDLPLRCADGSVPSVRDADPEKLLARRIVTARHCFGCTAGAGSSCGGSLA